LPYNSKVWAHPLSALSYSWISERVAQVDLERLIFNILEDKDDAGWGPNNTFRFPSRGGTGEIWRRISSALPTDRIKLGKRAVWLDTAKRRVRFEDGTDDSYDVLISTAPLDRLVLNSDLEDLKPAVRELAHSSTHVIGIGLHGNAPEPLTQKCWMYYPENDVPFYRGTVFSNYSPNNVPDAGSQWSLMVEASESPARPVNSAAFLDQAIASLVRTHMIDKPADVVDTWRHVAEYGYPVPTLSRDAALRAVLPVLEQLQIYSRGRFGGWRYEVGNQDHAFMQGVEVAYRLLHGREELTLWNAEAVNRGRG
jgi:protoporphyrinogen oxidase